MLALVKGVPKVLQLREVIRHYIEHRNEVVRRRTQFDLDAAEKRAHILEGYIIALDNIDEVIQVIKKSKDADTAQKNLIKRFKLSEAGCHCELRRQPPRSVSPAGGLNGPNDEVPIPVQEDVVGGSGIGLQFLMPQPPAPVAITHF